MSLSWTKALDEYCYPVDLASYKRASEFPGFFDRQILGNRASTIAFEIHYQHVARQHYAAFLEVVYWKLYSQRQLRNKVTSRVSCFFRERGVTCSQLWAAVQAFSDDPTISTLRKIRELLGFTTPVLAVPATLPALASPSTIPMVDNQVARWVNMNAKVHSINRKSKLAEFSMNYTSLRENDFPSYLKWVVWCREVAGVLTRLTGFEWRARDVEMAVFTAQRSGLQLNVLR